METERRTEPTGESTRQERKGKAWSQVWADDHLAFKLEVVVSVLGTKSKSSNVSEEKNNLQIDTDYIINRKNNYIAGDRKVVR